MLYPDLAAGFKHPQWRKGGDTAFQANTLTPGFATTVGGSPENRGNAGGAALFCGRGWGAQSWEDPGPVVAPEHFPHPQHVGLGAQEDHPYTPAPT